MIKDEIIKYIDIIIKELNNDLLENSLEKNDAITIFYNWIQEDRIDWNVFKENYEKLDNLELNPDEKKYLDELYKLINLLDTNEFIKLDSDYQEKLVTSPLFIRFKSTIIHLYSSAIKKLSDNQNIQGLKDYWEQFKEKLINLPEDKYIDNVEEFNRCLYKTRTDLKFIKIPLLSLIFEYNMNVGNRNYKELTTQIQSMGIDQTDVIEIFKKYGYDFTKATEEMKNNILANCTIENIDFVLDFYKRYNIRFDITKDDKYLIILYKTTKEIVTEIENFVNNNGLSMISFLRKSPSAFSNKSKVESTREHRKVIVDPPARNKDGVTFAGSFQDFKENTDLIKSLGYDVEASYRTCPSIFVYSSSRLKKNIEALKLYGIDVAKDHDNIKLSGLRSSKILETIDQFVELGELDYLKENTSRLQLPPDSYIFYRLYYVKKLNQTGQHFDYHGRMVNGQITYKNEIVDIRNNTLGINSANRKARVGAIESNILPDIVKEIVDGKIQETDNSTYDPTVLQDPEVLFFDNNFYYDEIAYNIAGKIISRFKFLRLYSALRNSGLASNHDIALYVLTYNTIMSPDEYELMMETIASYGRGL